MIDNTKGTIEYGSADFYEGEILDNKPHGVGIMKYSKNDAYKRESFSGYWFSGNRHGKGQLVMQSGDTYEGIWDTDKMADQDLMKIKWKNGNQYIG